jgi:uncharacterized protein YbjT (DUF2867 family)
MFLIAGASSGSGQLVTAKLLARKLPTRVLVRSDAQVAHFRALGAETVQGEIGDDAALARACSGASTVISLVGRHFADSRARLWAVDALGNAALIKAAVLANARRFVLLSALWADRELPPVLLGAKRHAERALMKASMDYAILRPSTFTTGASSLVGAVGPSIERWGLAFVPRPDSKPISFITLSDVADAIVAAALDHRRSLVVDLGGPEAITMAEGARRLAAVLQKQVRIIGVPRLVSTAAREVARRRSFGAYESMLFLDMLADHGDDSDPEPTRQLLGREPQSVDQALREYYATPTRLTPWRDSNIGILKSRAT